MAYDGAGLSVGAQLFAGKQSVFVYRSDDTFAGTVNGALYFSDGVQRGMKLGDLVHCVKTSDGSAVLAYVSTVTGNAATVTALAFAGSFANITATGNALLGDAAADLIGFYGATGASQRAAAIQATSAISASSFATVGSNLAAFLTEVANTLQGLGLWKGQS